MGEDEIKERYGPFAASYDATVLGEGEYALHEQVAEQLIEAFTERGLVQPRVLDLGCGTGLSARPLLERGWRIVGIDLTPEMLEHAAKLPFEKLIEHDITKPLPIPDGSFDGAIITGVLELIEDPGIVLANARPKLAEHGLVGMSLPLPRDDGIVLDILTHDPARIEADIEERGFTILRSHDGVGYVKLETKVLERVYLLERTS